MQLIKLIKKTKNKTDHVRFIVDLICLLNDIKLSDNEKTILSYFINYKISESTKTLIFKSGLLKAINSYKNLLTKFKRLKLIEKNETTREYYVNNSILNNIENTMGILLKIDNT